MTTSEAFQTLFFVSDSPIGRSLPEKIGQDDKPVTGPWRDTRKTDAGAETSNRPITSEMIALHFTGHLLQNGFRAMLMPYTVNALGMAAATAIDMDVVGEGHADLPHHFKTVEDAMTAIRALCIVAAALGLRVWIETTRGGGKRLWIFHHPLPAADARDLGRLLLKRAELHLGIEVFPKQTIARPDGTGNGVFLPYWGGAAPGRQVITDPLTGEEMTADAFAEAALASRSTPEVVAAIVQAARESGEITATRIPAPRQERAEGPDGECGDVSIAMWTMQTARCAYLRGLVEQAESGQPIGYDDWLRLGAHLRIFGAAGRKEYHRLSEFDGRYDAVLTDHKFDSLTGGSPRCDTAPCEKNPHVDCGLPEGKVSSAHWAYKGIRLMMANEKKLQEDGPPSDPADVEQPEESGFDFRNTMPASPFVATDLGIFISRQRGKETVTDEILPHSLYIGGRTEDLDTGVESVTLIWRRDNQWKRKTVPQRIVASTREIVTLADASLLVNSGNAKDLVSYVAHLQALHKVTIPLSRAVSTCGWKETGGEPLFMWGATPITAREAPHITFAAETLESGELTAALREGGTPEGWATMARRLSEYPLAAFGVAASFLSPFLEDLGIGQNPILDYSGASSSGKTTVLKLAASVWGYAPENEGGLIRSWNSTAVFLERLAHTFAGLPIFLDESHVPKPEVVQAGLYGLANGSGKGRGAMAGGTQRTAKYRSVIFSAGEDKLTNASTWEGAGARVVTFWGSPFGPGQGDLVRSLTREALTHYGQAGPFVLRAYLQSKPELLASLRSVHQESIVRLMPRATDAIGERLAPVFAAVEAVGTLINLLLDLKWDMAKITDTAFAKAVDSRPVSSKQQALEMIVSWADGNLHKFTGPGGEYDPRSPSEIAGHVRTDGALCFSPDVLKRLLAERRFVFDGTLSNWADAGWIERDAKGQQHAKLVKVNNKPKRMIVLNPGAAAVARGDVEYKEDAEVTPTGY